MLVFKRNNKKIKTSSLTKLGIGLKKNPSPYITTFVNEPDRREGCLPLYSSMEFSPVGINSMLLYRAQNRLLPKSLGSNLFSRSKVPIFLLNRNIDLKFNLLSPTQYKLNRVKKRYLKLHAAQGDIQSNMDKLSTRNSTFVSFAKQKKPKHNQYSKDSFGQINMHSHMASIQSNNISASNPQANSEAVSHDLGKHCLLPKQALAKQVLVSIEYPLETYHRSNQDTCLIHRPAVSEGQWVQSGDLLADCSASAGGELSLGQNLLVAYMPWEGYNFEDAILISERLVYDDLYTSIHIEKYEMETVETKLGMEQITRDIPDVKESEIKNLDKNGIIKLGTWVQEGDILVGKITPINKKNHSPYQKLLYTILDKQFLPIRDSSLRAPKGIKAKVISIKRFSLAKTVTQLRDKAQQNKLKQASKIGKKEKSFADSAASKNDLANNLVVSQKSTTIDKNLVNNGLPKKGVLTKRLPSGGAASVFLVKGRGATKLLAKMNRIRTSEVQKFTNSQKTKKEKYQQNLVNINLQKSLGSKDPSPTGKLKTKILAKRYVLEFLKTKLVRIKKDPLFFFCFWQSQKQKKKKNKRSFFSIMLSRGIASPNRVWETTPNIASINTLKKKTPFLITNNLYLTEFLAPPIGGTKTSPKKQSPTKFGVLAIKNKIKANQIKNKQFEKKEKLANNKWPPFIFGPGGTKNKLKLGQPLVLSVAKIDIYLAERRKLQVGDKMAGRHGNKGIISQILPREDMPFLPDGTPIDMVLNPLGVPSRMNVGQIYECLLGLAASKLGEIFRCVPFDEIYGAEASRSFVYSKLFEARVKTGAKWLFDPNTPGKIRLYDGRTGDCFDQAVTVGQAYMLRLVHMVDDKIHARSTGPYSLVTQQPLRGRAKQGGQRLGEMEVWALEGYGAAFTLLEMLTIKSDDMTGRMTLWSNLILNKEISIGTPESFKVLICELQALCLDIGLFRFLDPQLKPHIEEKYAKKSKELLLKEKQNSFLRKPRSSLKTNLANNPVALDFFASQKNQQLIHSFIGGSDKNRDYNLMNNLSEIDSLMNLP